MSRQWLGAGLLLAIFVCPFIQAAPAHRWDDRDRRVIQSLDTALGAPDAMAGNTQLKSARRAASESHEKCQHPSKRYSWTQLNADEKRAFFEADLCLINTPSNLTGRVAGVKTRYDDLVAVHQLQSNFSAGTDSWHAVGQFLHVHRYFVHVYEHLLRTECHYKGPLPYWPEEETAGRLRNSSFLADFGGVGDENGIVRQGPFANLTCNLGPGTKDTRHLLSRNVSDATSLDASEQAVNVTLAKTTFAVFMDTARTTIHSAGHGAIGGEMVNVMTSLNDPVFWCHHTWLDRVWWRWQGAAPASRTYEIAGAGHTTQTEPATGWINTTLDTVLYSYDILPNVTVRDVSDTQGGYLCYTYD